MQADLHPPLPIANAVTAIDEAKARHEDRSSKPLAKEAEILSACKEKNVDGLRALAKSAGGFISDGARQAAWPILLGCDLSVSKHAVPWQDLPRHRDEDQVALDVNRSFVYYPKYDTEKRTEERKAQLANIIVAVLRRNPFLNYFQGYHDIAQVFLLVLGPTAAVPAVERLSLLRIRDFMLPTMAASLSHLSLLPALLSAADADLHRHLAQTAPFYFALPATLTLYAHDIQGYGDIARLFDYLLASEAVSSIYLFAIIICSRKDQLLELEPSEHDMLHATLSKLPKPLDLDALIARTALLFDQWPPERLRGLAWYGISRNSVLKTARRPIQVVHETSGQGEVFFRKHAQEIQRHDTQREILERIRHTGLRYRRPAFFIGSSALVVVLSLYLTSDPTTTAPHPLLKIIEEWGRMLSAAFQSTR